jgi:cell division protease FtsH
MISTIKKTLFWFVILVVAFLLWKVVQVSTGGRPVPDISYSEFLSQVEAGNVVRVSIMRSQIDGTYRDNRDFHVTAPSSQEGMLQTLRQKNVEIWIRDPDGGTWALVCSLLPLLVLVGLWISMLRQIKAMKKSQLQMSQVGNPPAAIG